MATKSREATGTLGAIVAAGVGVGAAVGAGVGGAVGLGVAVGLGAAVGAGVEGAAVGAGVAAGVAGGAAVGACVGAGVASGSSSPPQATTKIRRAPISSMGMANLGDKRTFKDMGTSRGLMAARLTLGYWSVKLTIRLCIMIPEITYILLIRLFLDAIDSVLNSRKMTLNHRAAAMASLAPMKAKRSGRPKMGRPLLGVLFGTLRGYL